MDTDSIKTAYRRYAKFYDGTFGRVFEPGRIRVIDSINASLCRGQQILEVGVGTGLSLPLYREDVVVTGIDLSKEMLEVAEQRIASKQVACQATVMEMDAECLKFPDNHFDAVMALYIASVVPNPKKFIAEISRVCQQGGDIFILNHFASTHFIIKTLEKAISPLSKLIGFRPHMTEEQLLDQAELQLVHRERTNFLGYFTLLHFRKPITSEPNGSTQRKNAKEVIV